jgi:hypothetical protein
MTKAKESVRLEILKQISFFIEKIRWNFFLPVAYISLIGV